MSGLEMRYTLDDGELLAQIDALIARGGNLKPAFDDIGQDMVAITKRSFEGQRSPEGVAWLPSAAARKRGNPTLFKTGNLSGSFSYEASETGVVYGTMVPYAAFHQTGYSFNHTGRETKLAVSMMPLADALISVPARPFVGASDTDLARWESDLRDYLAGGSEGGAA